MNLNCSRFTSELLNERSLPTCKVKNFRRRVPRRVTRRLKSLVSRNHLDCAAIRNLTLAAVKHSLRSDVSSSTPIYSTPARQNISRRRLFLSQKQQRPRCSRGVTVTQNKQTTFRDVVEGLDRNQLNHLGKLFKNFKELDENDNDDETKTKFLYQVMAYIASLAFLGQRKPEEIPKLDGEEADYKDTFINGTVRYFNSKERKNSISQSIEIKLTTPLKKTGELTIDGLTNPFVVIQHGQSITQRIPQKENDDSWSPVQSLLIRKDSIQKDPIKFYLYLFDGGSSQGTNGSGINSLEELRRLHEVVLKAEFDVPLTDGKTAKTHTIELHVGKPGHKDSKTEVQVKLQFTTKVEDFACTASGGCSETRYIKNIGPVPTFLYPLPASDNDEIPVKDSSTDWKSWDEMLQSKGKRYNHLFPIAYVDATSSMTQAWIYGNVDKKILMVNFPGTDTSQWKDLITNIEQDLKSVKEIVEDDLILKPKNRSEKAKVHQGYKHAYLSIRDILLQILYSICKWEEKWLIITTGHSLGGSLASLAAYDIANRTKVKDVEQPDVEQPDVEQPDAEQPDVEQSNVEQSNVEQPNVAMFVYGPPSVGNETFYDSFQESVPLGFHMVAHNDKVATSICPDLKRVGKAFPMNSADMEDIKDVLDTIVKDDLSSSSKDNENILQSQNLKAIQGMLAHLEQNYFDVISKFVETVFSPKKAP